MLFEDVVAIKQHNIKRLLTAIRFNDNLTKRDIADITKLSIATITNLCNELIAKGVLSEGDYSQEVRIGRTPSLMKFLFNRFYVLALDFQFENIVGLAIMNLRNEICFSDSILIPQNMTVNSIINTAKDRFSQIVAEMHIEGQIIGIGASVPAVYDRNDGLIKCSSIQRYQNIPLKQMLSDTFGCPSYVDNCASIRAISAYAQQESPGIVCLDVSQGVGCGVLIRGDVLSGKNGYATEIAHIPLGDMNKTCPACGSRGCVETDLNIESIIRYFNEINDDLPLPEKWAQCVELLKAHSNEMTHEFDYLGRLLGQVASILINLFDPYDFYITGFITDMFPLIAESFWKEVRGRSAECLNTKLQIKVKECNWSDVFIGISDAIYHRWLPEKSLSERERNIMH